MFATAGYGAHAHSYNDGAVNVQSYVDNDDVAEEEEYISTFFVQASYDYQSTDPSSLSFRKGDIIEVLSCLESGWWDGLLGEERGWFPSNYVQVLPTQQQPVAPEPAQPSHQQQQNQRQEQSATLGAPVANGTHVVQRNSVVDMADVMGGDEGAGWVDAGVDLQRAVNGIAGVNLRESSTSTTDFWVPRVTQDGQVRFWSNMS